MTRAQCGQMCFGFCFGDAPLDDSRDRPLGGIARDGKGVGRRGVLDEACLCGNSPYDYCRHWELDELVNPRRRSWTPGAVRAG
jgi:hypothetical protein